MELLQHNILKFTRIGQIGCLIESLAAGADVDYIPKHNHSQFYDKGRSALMIACETGNLEAEIVLVRYGANVNLQSTVDEHRMLTAMMVAAMRGKAECLTFLLDAGADVNLQDWWGDTALMLALKQNPMMSTVMPLALHPNLNRHLTNRQGETAHDIAMDRKGMPSDVRRLFDSIHESEAIDGKIKSAIGFSHDHFLSF